MQELALKWRGRGLSIGFVPTMGALHEGHAFLLRKARKQNDLVVASVFVNPLQFGPREDYLRYPRPFGKDRALCLKEKTDVLFRPTIRGMYRDGSHSKVEVQGLSEVLCGAFRPGHFAGVATVVLKLFQIVQPTRAYFGEKDFQQLKIVEKMARDFNLPVRIVPCPVVRDKDGLALSSRNSYLSQEERLNASKIFQALKLCRRTLLKTKSLSKALGAAGKEIAKIPGSRTDYLEIVNPGTLARAERAQKGLRILAAVWIGKTRLIDNLKV